MKLASHKIQSPDVGDFRRLSNKLGAASAFRNVSHLQIGAGFANSTRSFHSFIVFLLAALRP
jgi:hypothetical protein